MKKAQLIIPFIVGLSFLSQSKAQQVSTIAGVQYTDSGKFNATATNPAADEYYSRPCGIAIDTNNRIYISDEHNIMMLDGSTSRNRGGYRGDPYSQNALGSDDGTGLASRFAFPAGLAVHPVTNDIYVCDKDNNLIRKGMRYVNSSNEAVWTTVTGQISFLGGYKDGSTSVAEFANPEDMEFDSKGNLYICDMMNHCIRKISNGQVTTVAGDGSVGSGFKDAVGKNARFSFPTGISLINDTFLLVADRNNLAIRKINLITQEVTTLSSDFNAPLDVLYVGTNASDGVVMVLEKHCIKVLEKGIVSLYAGKERTNGYSNSTLLNSRFGEMRHFTFSNKESALIVPDYGNNVIRKVPVDLIVKADFTTDNSSPIVNQTILLQSTSLGANSYKWEISPSTYTLQAGSKLTDKDIYVSFSQATSYSVKLTATGAKSNELFKANYINVSTNSSASPAVDFTSNNTNPKAWESILLIDLTANNPDSYEWSIEPTTFVWENGTDKNSRNPQVAFTAAGMYNITLKATNMNGSNSKVKNEFIVVSTNSISTEVENVFSVYPNPSKNGVFTIESLNIKNDISIYGIDGKKVDFDILSQRKIKVLAKPGCYILQHKCPNGYIASRKLIIE